MNDLTEYIASGILELYVLGLTSDEESREIELMAAQHSAISREIEAINDSLATYALAYATPPSTTVKPLVLATINYLERIQAGETIIEPPILTDRSQLTDYAPWLNRTDMVPPPALNELYLQIICATPTVTTAIAWITDRTEAEVHRDTYEKFLIVEGTCTVTAGEEVHYLVPGDYFAIPLHTPHVVEVTSAVPCKAIVQRIAA